MRRLDHVKLVIEDTSGAAVHEAHQSDVTISRRGFFIYTEVQPPLISKHFRQCGTATHPRPDIVLGGHHAGQDCTTG